MSPPKPPRDWQQNNDGDQPSQTAKRLRCSGDSDDKQMQLLEEVRNILQKQNEKLESMFWETQYLRERVSCLTADVSRLDGCLQQSPAPRILPNCCCSIPLQLKFLNSCKNDKYSKHKIEADDKTPLKVAICDLNNNIITSEPFSSMRVHIVPIQGDFDNDHTGQWTEEYFRSKIVSGRPGKEPLLFGDLYIRLQDGVGYLETARFQDNSSFVTSKRFKLGVMAADERISERIQEGLTEAFAVKDIRGYSTKKNPNPSPHDPVYKLRKIAKDGDRRKLLEENGIKTVQDFVSSYNHNHEELRKILGKISDQDWDTVIDHAQKCNPPGNLEHQTISRSDGSFYLQGSSSMQPTSLAQQKKTDVYQQSSSTYTDLPSGIPLDNAPGQVMGIQPEEQVRSVALIDISKQGHSSGYDTMLGGNALPHINPTMESNNKLGSLPDSRVGSLWRGLRSNPFEQSGGRSPASEAGTPASEVGSCGNLMGYSPLPSPDLMGYSPLPSPDLMGYSPLPSPDVHGRGNPGLSPSPAESMYSILRADNMNNASSTDFIAAEEDDLAFCLDLFNKSFVEG